MMKTIKKIISLENSKSRVPGLIPSLINNEFVKYDEKSLETMYNGNYGLIVSDIEITKIDDKRIVDKITDHTDIYVNIKKGDDDFYLIEPYKRKDSEYYIENNNIYHNGNVEKYLSYYTLNKWYHFFEEYYDLLNVDTCDNPREYKSAIDFYNDEIDSKSEEQENYYKSLDLLFESRGGDEFYKWIKTNCIVKYDIPSKFKDGWNTTYLYYPELMKWKGWFSERYNKYSTIKECSNTTDCCDCEEYLKKGGNEFYSWIKNVKIIPNSNSIDMATITIPINITTTIDDMGETSTFAEEWVAGEDYSKYKDGNYDIKSNGTLAIYNQNLMMHNENNNSAVGFLYDKDYKEILFAEKEWVNYYDDVYYKNNKDGLKPTYSTYTYNRKFKFIGDPTVDKLSEKYDVVEGPLYEISDEFHKPFNSDYIEVNKMFYTVKYYENDAPYVILNGKTYMGIWHNGSYKFNFKYKECSTTQVGNFITISKNGSFIQFNNSIYKINNNSVTIGNLTYPKLDGYTNIDNVIYYLRNGEMVRRKGVNNGVIEYEKDKTFGEANNKDKGYIINGKKITLYFPFEEIASNVITGITDSKLTTLKDFKKAFDDIGYELPGLFEIKQVKDGTIMSQPKEGDTLDLYYKVGNINNLSQMKDENNEPIENSFWGDIITNMEFFYYYYDGVTKVEETRVIVSGETNNLEAIEDCIKKHEEQLKKNVIMEEKMSCEIIYYFGAKLKQNVSFNGKEYKYDGYKLDDEKSGIKYTDIVKIIKKETMYHLSKTDFYPIFYYDMEFELNDVVLNEYENKELTTNRTIFKMYTEDDGYYKGFMAAPTIREEYKFGTVMKPKIKRDVYIERGINKAIDKHLKLGEIGSFEALENYNNGFFNIINNNL